MTREDHLLVILMEECAEVQKRASKALRFGLDEVQDGQELTNRARLNGEIIDLISMVDMLEDSETLSIPFIEFPERLTRKKKEKVEDFLLLSDSMERLAR